jgi:hypothetical protein
MATTKWINVNGGDTNVAGNWDAGVPDSTIDAVIDAASFAADGKVINIAANFECKSFDCSAADQLFTISSAVYTFSVYGAFTGSNKLTMTLTGTSFFYCKDTGTFTQGSAILNLNQWHVNQAGITVTSGDNFSIGASKIRVVNGTWLSNDKTITTTGSISADLTATKVITLGSSVVNCVSLDFSVNTGLTFNCNTSTINVTNGGFYGGNQIFYNVNLVTYGSVLLHGTNTFTNLSISAGPVLIVFLNIYNNNIVSNTLTLSGNNATNYRLILNSTSMGTARQITAGQIVATNVDFRDITLQSSTARTISSCASDGGTGTRFLTSAAHGLIAGTTILIAGTTNYNGNKVITNVSDTTHFDIADAYVSNQSGTWTWDLSAISGLSGDCGGNSGATFTTGTTLYYKHTSGACTWKDTTKWFTDYSPRTTAASRVPLPQDTNAIFDDLSFTGSSTLTIDVPRLPSHDMSLVNQAVASNLANAIEVYGHLILGNNITPGGSYNRIMTGRGTFTINTYNKPMYMLSFAFSGITNSYTFLSDTTLNAYDNSSFNYGITTAGIVDFNDFNFTTLGILSFYFGIFYLGNGLITISSVNTLSWNYTGGTLYAEGSTIKFTAASGSANITFTGGGKIYNKVQFSGSHTGNFDITGANTIAKLIVDKGRKVRFTAATTNNIADMEIGDNVTWSSVTAAQHTINYTGSKPVQMKFANVSWLNVVQRYKLWAGASVNGGGNTNVMFGFFGKSIAYLNGSRVMSAMKTMKPMSVNKVVKAYKV